jgi:hypothetical protein
VRCAPAALALLALAAHAAIAQDAADRALDDTLRINELQVVGTHNSYKLPPSPDELRWLARVAPSEARSIDYGHRPLERQLDDGVRALELDLMRDPDPGRYADPLWPRLVRLLGATPARFDAAPLRRPGLKVLHAQDVDYRSNCQPFADCLLRLRAWSDAHPDHVPLLVSMNLWSGPSRIPFGVEAPGWDAAGFDALDAEIRAVFPPARLLTPDSVRGDRPSLREAVLAGGWPTLAEARGRVLFLVDEAATVGTAYAARPGAVAFADLPEHSPHAAVLIRNDPLREAAEIARLVRAGFIVRTRADEDTREARANDTRRRDAALASGAQVVSTDYPEPRAEFGAYRVALPGAVSVRPNPLLHAAHAPRR